MHTYSNGQWRIHHNGDLSGEIILCELLSPVGSRNVRTDFRRILSIVKTDYAPGNQNEQDYSIRGIGGDGQPDYIDVPLSLLVDFVAQRYIIPKMMSQLEDADTDELMKFLPLLEKRNG